MYLCSDIAYIVLVDLAFAVLPWTFIPQLQMPKGEKYMVAGTMSLGILAAASGIKRTVELGGFWGADILAGSVQTVMWSTVEVDLTLLCIAVPVIIPLFRTCVATGRQHIRSKKRSQGYQKHSRDKSSSGHGSEDRQQLALRTIGGSEFQPNNSSSGSGGDSIAKTNSETHTRESSTRVDSPV